jgi:hypothetical protein
MERPKEQRSLERTCIGSTARVGGLHRRYTWAEAA